MSLSLHDLAKQPTHGDDLESLQKLAADLDVTSLLSSFATDADSMKQLSGLPGFGMEGARDSLPPSINESPSSLLDEPSHQAASSSQGGEGKGPKRSEGTSKKRGTKHATKHDGKGAPKKPDAQAIGASALTLKQMMPSQEDQEAIEMMLLSKEAERIPHLAEIYGGIEKEGDYLAKSKDTCVVDLLFDKKLAEKVDEFQTTHKVRNPKEAIEEVVKHVHAQVGKDKQARSDSYKGGGIGEREGEEKKGKTGFLGDMIDAGATMCREKAIYAQILLAGYGVATKLVSGSREGEAKEGEDTPLDGRHTWLETLEGSVIDAMWGQVGPPGATVHRARYNKVVVVQSVVKPAQPTPPEEVEKAILEAKV